MTFSITGANRVSLPVNNDDRLLSFSGVKAKAFQTPCNHPLASTTSSPLPTKSATSVMNFSTLGERLLKEGGARKRNLSEFADSSSILIDETVKERIWTPQNQRSLVNTWYQFDGRTEPSSPGITRFDNNEYGDISYRRRLDDMSTPRSKLDVCDSADGLNNVFHGPEKAHDSGYEERGWSQVALQAINVVAGKAWEFCKNSTAIFRGFHAGGGTRYKLKYNEDSDLYFEAVENINPVKKNFCEPSHSSLYGESPCISQSLPSNSYDDVRLDYSPQRPPKRYQLSSNNNDSLERNWVVVPTVASTPNKNCHGLAAKRKLLSTNLPRCSPTQTRSYGNAASRATGGIITCRKPSLRTFRPQVSHAGSPTLSSTHRASFASPRSSGGFIPRLSTPNSRTVQKHTQDIYNGSPIALESKRQAQKWAVMLKKGEKKQEESIQRLDERLKEMIRQGKEALGSKFEVSLEDYDENETI
ncbi:hypothetical protein OnM2_056037 [Erysiphe neolycopersici]|uniref:Uncharacterized protein n=1 Tax=Erysiphe neolycopersici TaxID=212602 RepID=A0A420HR84_9PEZI|nr:hypothetical protein OnM2_056037 [Erysiphe neolycopersici]